LVDILSKRQYNKHMNTATVAKHLALILTLSGALATALTIDPLNIWLLNAGALLYLYWSVSVRDWNLVAVNGGLLTIYVIGAIIRLT
jgi:thiosulfate reductase cytochrome b subunit